MFWDNIKSYSPADKTITIYNWNIIGQLFDWKLAEYKLTDNTYQCLINCHAEGTAVLYEDEQLFKDIKFLDKNNDLINIKNSIISIEQNYQIDVPDYVEICKDVEVIDNKTMEKTTERQCHGEKSGTHQETRQHYIEYKGEVLRQGTYHWKIEGTKSKEQSIDWIANAYGKDLSEWAWWNGAWTFRKEVNVTGGNGMLTNFTVWLSVPKSADMNADYSDLRFVEGKCSGTQDTEMSYELDLTNTTSAGVWLKFQVLNAGAFNNTVCMYYGNAGAGYGQNPSDVWSNWTAVWHFTEGTGSATKDSKGIYNGTLVGGSQWAMGLFGNKVVLNGSEYINITNNNVGFGDLTGGSVIAYMNGTQSATSYVWDLRVGGGAGYTYEESGKSADDTGKYWFNTTNSDYRFTAERNTWFADIGCTQGLNSVQTFSVGRRYASAFAHMTGSWDELRVTSRLINPIELTRIVTDYNTTNYVFGAEDTPGSNVMSLNVTLLNPQTNLNTTSTSIDLSASVTVTNGNLTNMTLYIWKADNSVYGTNTTIRQGISNSTNATFNIAEDGDFNWNFLACAVNSTSTLCGVDTNRTFTRDATAPSLTVYAPIAGLATTTMPINVTLNVTTSDTHIDSCWFNTNENDTNITYTCNTFENATFTNAGAYTINIFANDTFGNINTTSVSYSINSIIPYMNITTPGVEGENFSVVFNVTANITQTNASVVYDSVYYPMIQIFANSSFAQYERNITAPRINTNTTYPIYVSYFINNEVYATGSKMQEVLPIILRLCNSTYNIPYINFSFWDENNNGRIDGTTDSAIWNYYVDDPAVSEAYTYNMPTNQTNYTYCFSPPWKTIHASVTYYYASTDYPQRIFSGSFTLSNATTEKNLFLLSSSVGVYVTFQVLDASSTPLNGVLAEVTRDVFGTLTNITSGTTGGDGGVTFWLNPNFLHTFTFSKAGYTDVVTSITPSQPQYTIYMGGYVNVTPSQDFGRGITYTVTPSSDILNNNTFYVFNFSIASNYWSLTDYGFWLENDSGAIASISDTTATGGSVVLNRSTLASGKMTMHYYWNIGGNYSNSSRQWKVLNNADYGFGISKFLSDLGTFTTARIFGINSWALSLIIYLLIFIAVGWACYSTNLYSPAVVAGMLFGLVFLFDVVLGLITAPFGVAHLPTILTLFVFVVFIIREVMR